MNNVGLYIIFLLLLMEGVISLVSPITMVKVVLFLPNFIVSKSMRSNRRTDGTRYYSMLDKDPNEHKVLRRQLLLTRLGGLVSILVSVVILLVIIVDASGCCSIEP
jgi:hypothetical protein